MRVLFFLLFCISLHLSFAQSNIRYFLWNRGTVNEEISTNNYGSNVIRDAPWKIQLHGWNDDSTVTWYASATDGNVNLGANVVLVDWSAYSRQTYSAAVAELPNVSLELARFVLGLVESEGVPLSNVHLIGHGLGAHLAGFTGKTIQNLSRQNLGRITGLDPARLGFTAAPRTGRLDASDANGVDVIHTDAGLFGSGIGISIGDVDFWPNGIISMQPGCSGLTCSHHRSAWYYIEGISSRRFVSQECESILNYISGYCSNNQENLLGEFTDHSRTGDYFLLTNSQFPFARG